MAKLSPYERAMASLIPEDDASPCLDFVSPLPDSSSDFDPSDLSPHCTDVSQVKPTSRLNLTTHQMVELRKLGWTNTQISKVAGITDVAVYYRLKRWSVTCADVDTFKSNRAEILTGLQERFVNSISDNDLARTPVGSRIQAVSQLHNMERLERGQSTANVAVRQIDDSIEALEGELKALREAYKKTSDEVYKKTSDEVYKKTSDPVPAEPEA